MGEVRGRPEQIGEANRSNERKQEAQPEYLRGMPGAGRMRIVGFAIPDATEQGTGIPGTTENERPDSGNENGPPVEFAHELPAEDCSEPEMHAGYELGCRVIASRGSRHIGSVAEQAGERHADVGCELSPHFVAQSQG